MTAIIEEIKKKDIKKIRFHLNNFLREIPEIDYSDKDILQCRLMEMTQHCIDLSNHLDFHEERFIDMNKKLQDVAKLKQMDMRDMGITVGATIGSFSFIILGIISNFLFYSFAGLILLALAIIHTSGRK